MFLVMTIAALLVAVIIARLIYWSIDAPPVRRYCVYCKTTTYWREEVGCELCNEDDIS
jgi:hypothetical protein